MPNVFAVLFVDDRQDDPTVGFNPGLEIVGALLIALVRRLEFSEEVGGHCGQYVLLLYSRISQSISI